MSAHRQAELRRRRPAPSISTIDGRSCPTARPRSLHKLVKARPIYIWLPLRWPADLPGRINVNQLFALRPRKERVKDGNHVRAGRCTSFEPMVRRRRPAARWSSGRRSVSQGNPPRASTRSADTNRASEASRRAPGCRQSRNASIARSIRTIECRTIVRQRQEHRTGRPTLSP